MCSRADRHTQMSDRQPLTPQPAGWERDGVKQTLLQKAGQGPDLLPLSQTDRCRAKCPPTPLWANYPERKNQERTHLGPVPFIFFLFKTNFIEI